MTKKMNTSEISERELKIIDEISQGKNLTQRKISQRLGLSLGMTNLTLKRLANKGYIKLKGLNRRKVQYILTRKGFAEKAKRSYRYFLATIHSVKEMKKKIQQLILMKYEEGRTHFIILGDGELADITELSLKELGNSELEYRRVSKLKDIDNRAVILLTQSELDPGYRTLDLDNRTNRWIDVLSAISGKNEL